VHRFGSPSRLQRTGARSSGRASSQSGNIAVLPAPRQSPRISVVIPVWNGRQWLEGCLGSLAAQRLPADQTIVVDNGSVDGSVAFVRDRFPNVVVIELGANTGFAHAANVGIGAADGDAIALLNTDVVLAPDWLTRMVAALVVEPAVGSVACKMLALDRPEIVYDAGDVLRRDGACEQRGRFGRDDGRFDAPGEVFGACAGAALYRRAALAAVGGFDDRYFAYLEDVDLALRLRLRGWRCRYEPVVAWHAGEGSSHQLRGGHRRLVERNTLVLVAKAFPARWLPLVAYRQLGWAWHALRDGVLCDFLAGALQALPMIPGAVRSRPQLRNGAVITIGEAVPARPIRGPRAGGHPSQHAPGVSGDRSRDRAVR
jgi:GT2 family glycosyltransferase